MLGGNRLTACTGKANIESETNAHNENINAYYDSPAVHMFEDFAKQQIHLGYWDDKYPHVTVEQAAARLTQVVIDFIDLPKGGRLLDIGCGCGVPALEIAKQKHCLIEGITINARQKAEADRLARQSKLSERISFTVGDACFLPYDNEVFDFALMLESIHHIGHQQALREARRVLKSGAQILIADGLILKENASTTDAVRLLELFVGRSLVTQTELRALMQDEGFEGRDMINLTKAIQPTWTKLIDATHNNKQAVVKEAGQAFYESLIGFWEEMRTLWLRSADYLLVVGTKL